MRLPVKDRDAFFHIWRVIGHILGVDERVNPAEFDDGAALFDTILQRQQAPSEARTALTKGVLDFIREVLPGPAFARVAQPCSDTWPEMPLPISSTYLQPIAPRPRPNSARS